MTTGGSSAPWLAITVSLAMVDRLRSFAYKHTVRMKGHVDICHICHTELGIHTRMLQFM